LKAAIKLKGAQTRQKVIAGGLREVVRLHHCKALTGELGTFEL